MKTRKDAVILLKQLMDHSDKLKPDDDGSGSRYLKWHFGRQELRQFLDWLYDGTPKDEDERL